MASFELTPMFMLGALTTLSSMLVATWALSRRSRDWDEAERLRRVIDGEPDKGKKGLTRDIEELSTRTIPELQNALTATTEQLKWIKYGLNAHGSEEHIVVDAVRRSISEKAKEIAKEEIDRAHKETVRLRRQLVAEQNRLLGIGVRDEETFVAEVVGRIDAEADPFPDSEDSARSPQIPRPRDSAPGAFRPEDTGRFGPSKKKPR